MDKEYEEKHRGHFLNDNIGTLDDIRRFQKIESQYLNMLMEENFGNVPKVLDVGASEGYFGTINPEWDYTAIDLVPSNDNVVKMEMCEVTDNYDFIIYNHVIEHIPRYQEVLEHTYKVLNEGGMLFIAVPAADTPWAWEVDGHYNMFNEANLTRILTEIGFTHYEDFRVKFRGDCEEIWLTVSK